jgi:lipopolysaccharide export system protein LptA
LIKSIGWALAAAALAAVPAGAQANSCLLVNQNGPWTAVGDPANRVISADGPLLVRCDGGEELRADSAVLYQAINEIHLFGQVDFQDPTRALTSDRATYNSVTGRLYAQGNVVFTDKARGSTLRGPELEYYRPIPGRPEAQAIATQRPHLTLVPRNNGRGARREPMEIDADRITNTGEKFMSAEGNVVIVSKDVNSTAATAFYDATAERLELRTRARVKNPRYELQGEFIESQLKDGKLSRVLARTDARLDSERLDITGPQILIFLENEQIQRLVSARGPAAAAADSSKLRSVALAAGFRMEADSLDALLPGQQLREVHAVGTARGEAWDTIPTTRGDSTALVRQVSTASVPPTGAGERDLILADTILGYFATDSTKPRPARADTASPGGNTKLERMVAIGHARSVYRVKDKNAPAGQKPAINYLNGDHVDLAFAGGEVENARVRGLKRGVYFDPRQGGGAAPGARPAGTAAATPRAPAGAVRPGTDGPALGAETTPGDTAQARRPAPAGAPGRGTRPPSARPAAAQPAAQPTGTRP